MQPVAMATYNYCCSMQQQNFTVLSNSAECVQDEFLEMLPYGNLVLLHQHSYIHLVHCQTLFNVTFNRLSQYWNTTKIMVYSIVYLHLYSITYIFTCCWLGLNYFPDFPTYPKKLPGQKFLGKSKKAVKHISRTFFFKVKKINLPFWSLNQKQTIYFLGLSRVLV